MQGWPLHNLDVIAQDTEQQGGQNKSRLLGRTQQILLFRSSLRAYNLIHSKKVVFTSTMKHVECYLAIFQGPKHKQASTCCMLAQFQALTKCDATSAFYYRISNNYHSQVFPVLFLGCYLLKSHRNFSSAMNWISCLLIVNRSISCITIFKLVQELFHILFIILSNLNNKRVAFIIQQLQPHDLGYQYATLCAPKSYPLNLT